MDTVHKSVLLNECIEGLNLKSGALVLDGTFGGGGHSMAMCESVKDLKIIALDQDNDALGRGREKFKKASCDISFVHLNFRDMDKAGVEPESVDGILLDLGVGKFFARVFISKRRAIAHDYERKSIRRNFDCRRCCKFLE